MKIAFTICSNNYLSQAKTLGNSLTKLNPDYKFIIGLTDRLADAINYRDDIPYEIISIENLGIPHFAELWKKYDIVELNTCIKPCMFRYLFIRNPDIEFLLYFDPDILIFDKLFEIELKFRDNDFILTPHIMFPLDLSNERPNESDFLNFGIFNIGFLGLKNSSQILNNFLPWWQERTLKVGYNKPCKGLFVDQIWFNLVPLFFTKICILDHLGCNVAPWNLHERELVNSQEQIMVNDKYNLIFFHFSSFEYQNPTKLFYYYDRNLKYINNTTEYLYHIYCNLLIENNIELYSSIKCHYIDLKEKYDDDVRRRENTLARRIKNLVKFLLPVFLFKYAKQITRRVEKSLH